MGITVYMPDREVEKIADSLDLGVHELSVEIEGGVPIRGLYLRAFNCLIGLHDLCSAVWHWDPSDVGVAHMTTGPRVLVHQENLSVEIREER